MLLWPFNKYPGTDYETFNWEWILHTVKTYTQKVDDFIADITKKWNAFRADITKTWNTFRSWTTGEIDQMHDDFANYVSVTEGALNTGAIANGAITKPKINPEFLMEIENGYVTPEMFGAVGDGVSDDTDALLDMFSEACTNNIPVVLNKKYMFTEPLLITDPLMVTGPGELIYAGTGTQGYAVTIGREDGMTSKHNIKMRLKQVTPNLYGIKGVRIVNVLHGTFDMQVHNFSDGLTLDGYNFDCDYNLVYPTAIASNRRNIVLTATGSGAVNQNTFVGGSCRIDSNIPALINPGDVFYDLYLESGGSNIANNTTFLAVSFESAENVDNYVYNSAHNTLFLNCRFEGVKISEGSNSLGSRYIDGFNMFGSIDNVSVTAQLQDRQKQKLYAIQGYEYRNGNSNATYLIKNQNDIDIFKLDMQGTLEIAKHLTMGNILSMDNSHPKKTTITTGDTNPDLANRWLASIHLNTGGDYGKRFWIYDSNEWQNVLYTRAVPSTGRPTGVKNGYMLFDTTLKKPIWYYDENWYDATGTVV